MRLTDIGYGNYVASERVLAVCSPDAAPIKRLVAEAKEKADGIIRQAQNEAELELRRADESIKREIVDVSAVLTEKILGREINADDHRAMIDDFIGGMGEDNE